LRIAPAQLVFRQKYEIGAIRTGRHRDSAVRLGRDLSIDHAREVSGVLRGLA
jgi:phage anti-repressor protein